MSEIQNDRNEIVDGDQGELFHVAPVTLSVEDVVISVLTDYPADREFSMYALAGLVNKVLKALEITKNGQAYQVREQMMYNYAANGLVVKGVKDSKIRVNRELAMNFMIRFITRAQNN